MTTHFPFLSIFSVEPDLEQTFCEAFEIVKVTIAFLEITLTPTLAAIDLAENFCLAFTVLAAKSAAATCATKSTFGAMTAGGTAGGTTGGSTGWTTGGSTGWTTGGMTGGSTISTVNSFHLPSTRVKEFTFAFFTNAFGEAPMLRNALVPTGSAAGAEPKK